MKNKCEALSNCCLNMFFSMREDNLMCALNLLIFFINWVLILLFLWLLHSGAPPIDGW